MVLSKASREKLERFLRRRVESWEENTGPMRSELKELNDQIEGYGESVDFPFGAGQSSSIDIRYAAAKARTLRASFVRAVFSDPNILVAEVLPGAKRTPEDNLAEGAVNWTASKETNGIETLKDTPIPIFRDGTSLVFGEWVRRIERGVDFRHYTDAKEFYADYADHKEAGISEEKYDEIMDEFADEGEVHVEFETDFVAQNGPEYSICPLAKFIWGPLWTKDLMTAELYGYHFKQSETAFEQAVKHGFFDTEPADESRKKTDSSSDEWDASRDQIEGISTEDSEQVSYKIGKLVVLFDMDNDQVPERYWVYWDMESKKVLRVEQYGLWRNTPCMVPFKFVNRDGRLLGVSLQRDGRDLFREINALHRHRSNVRRLTDSVTLILPKALKEDVDLGAEYAEFRPGMTVWVPNDLAADKYPRQLQIFNTSRSNDSLDEEGYVVRYLDGLLGISEGQSGGESTQDPNAPAAKTRMLLDRADLRVEDLIEEWRRGIPMWTMLHIALYLANAKSKLKFMQRAGGDLKESEVALQVLANPKRRYGLKTSRSLNLPEYEMNRIAAMVAFAFQLRIPVQAKPQMMIEAWNDYVTASRIDQPERYTIEMGPDGQVSMGGQQMPFDQIQQQIQSMVAAKEMEMRQRGKGATKK